MNYNELVQKIEENTGINRVKINDVIAELVKIITAELKVGGSVTVHKLGVFKSYTRKAHYVMGKYRPESASASFEMSHALRDYLEES